MSDLRKVALRFSIHAVHNNTTGNKTTIVPDDTMYVIYDNVKRGRTKGVWTLFQAQRQLENLHAALNAGTTKKGKRG